MAYARLYWGGAFSGGQRLPEVAVAKQLGLSRNTASTSDGSPDFRRFCLSGSQQAAVASRRSLKDDIAGRNRDTWRDRKEQRRVWQPSAVSRWTCSTKLMLRLRRLMMRSQIPKIWILTFTSSKTHSFTMCWRASCQSTLIAREIERMSLLPLASPSAFLSDQALIPDFQDSLRYAQRPTPRNHRSHCKSRRRARRGTNPRTCASCSYQFQLFDRSPTEAFERCARFVFGRIFVSLRGITICLVLVRSFLSTAIQSTCCATPKLECMYIRLLQPEFSNWRDEQLAWRDHAVLFDQTHHMDEFNR